MSEARVDAASLRAVVFDVDGTLVDSERDGHRVAFNLAFEDLGMADRWDTDLYGELLEVTGGQRRLDGWLKRQGVDADERQRLVPLLHRRKTELFEELIADGKLTARPGAQRLIDDLDEAGVTLAVATTGSRSWVEPLLERLFGTERFATVVAGDDAPERKPDPSAYRMAVDDLGTDQRSTLTVEDSRNGLVAAKGAGLACVVVVNHYTADQDFSEADLVVDGFGTSDEPTSVLADPHDVDPPGQLDIGTLGRVLARLCGG